jgi:hypothetical protein
VQQASVIASYRGRLLSAHTAQNAGELRASRVCQGWLAACRPGMATEVR